MVPERDSAPEDAGHEHGAGGPPQVSRPEARPRQHRPEEREVHEDSLPIRCASANAHYTPLCSTTVLAALLHYTPIRLKLGSCGLNQIILKEDLAHLLS